MPHQGNESSIPSASLSSSPDLAFYNQLALVDNVLSRYSEQIPPFHIQIDQVQHTRSDPYVNGVLPITRIPEFGLARLSVVPRAPAILPGFTTVYATLTATGSATNNRNGVSQTATYGIASQVTENQSATNGIVSQTTQPQGATNGITSQATETQGVSNGFNSRATGSQGATNGINTSNQEARTEAIRVHTSNGHNLSAEDDISSLEL